MAGRKKTKNEYSMKPAAVAARKRRAQMEAAGSKPVARKTRATKQVVRRSKQADALQATELDPLVVVTVRQLDLQNRIEALTGLCNWLKATILSRNDYIDSLDTSISELESKVNSSKAPVSTKKYSKSVGVTNGTRAATPEVSDVVDKETDSTSEDYLT